MRKLIYRIGDYETTSYEEARKLQPTGRLTTELDKIEYQPKINPETLEKRRTYFAKKRAKGMIAGVSA